jgi:hypothetical protein
MPKAEREVRALRTRPLATTATVRALFVAGPGHTYLLLLTAACDFCGRFDARWNRRAWHSTSVSCALPIIGEAAAHVSVDSPELRGRRAADAAHRPAQQIGSRLWTNRSRHPVEYAAVRHSDTHHSTRTTRPAGPE